MIGKNNPEAEAASCKCSRHRGTTIKKKYYIKHPRLHSTKQSWLCSRNASIVQQRRILFFPPVHWFWSTAKSSLAQGTSTVNRCMKKGNKIRLYILHTEWNMKCNIKQQMWAFWLFEKREQTGKMIIMQCSSYICNHNKHDIIENLSEDD